MSMLGRTDSRDLNRALPQGELIGNYRSYLDAQKVVDYLADQEFPVQHVTIVGNDLKTVERVTGRLSYPRVALSGAATGAWFGLFVGLLLMLFGGGETYVLLISSMAMGAAFWMLFGIISYALQRGKRDFTSTNQVIATSYDVVVSTEVAQEARRLAAQLPMAGTAHAGAPVNQAPVPFGQQPPAGYGQQPPFGQQPQPPERPAQWGDDPYQGNAPVQQPQPGPGGQEAQPGQPVRGRYPDLPDGRPQYGIRVNPEPQAAAPTYQQTGSGQQAEPTQHAGPAGSEASSQTAGTPPTDGSAEGPERNDGSSEGNGRSGT
ncbi:general stress protein [Arthrobacter sp. NPDC089319]|uniref:general stress protein n=1 Tax=Arthrobacter sp. NPDC089319 TaxID=3155915 RepID=UPI003413D021